MTGVAYTSAITGGVNPDAAALMSVALDVSLPVLDLMFGYQSYLY